jgi:MFS family permease
VNDKASSVSQLQSPALTGDPDYPLIRKVVKRIIPFCIICFLLNYIDRTNVGMAESSMEHSIKTFNTTVFAIGFAWFYVPYCLLELPSNLIQQKVGARRWIARIMITWGMVSTCFIFVNGPAMFYLLRVLLGAAEAGFFPGVILYLSYWIPTRYRARVTALFVLAQAMAQMIGNTCGGFILYGAEKYGHSAHPWQWLFLLEGIPSMIMGVVVLFYLTDKPKDAKWLTEEERERLDQIMANDQAEKHSHGASEFKAAFLSPYTWILSIIYSGLVWGYAPVQGFSQVILKPVLASAGLIVLPPSAAAATASAPASALASAAATLPLAAVPVVTPTPGYIVNIYLGFLTAIPFAVAAVAMLFFARHSDRHNERKWHIAFAGFIMTCGLVLCALAPRYATGSLMTVLSVSGLTLAAIGWFCAFAIFWSVPAQLLTGVAVAAAVAIINSIGNLLGNFASSYLKGSFNTLVDFVARFNTDFSKALAGLCNKKGAMTDENFLLLAACWALLATLVAATLRLPEHRPQQS